MAIRALLVGDTGGQLRADGGGHCSHVAIGHDNALLRLAQHIRDAAGAVKRDNRQSSAQSFQHNSGERVLAGGQRKRVRG